MVNLVLWASLRSKRIFSCPHFACIFEALLAGSHGRNEEPVEPIIATCAPAPRVRTRPKRAAQAPVKTAQRLSTLRASVLCRAQNIRPARFRCASRSLCVCRSAMRGRPPVPHPRNEMLFPLQSGQSRSPASLINCSPSQPKCTLKPGSLRPRPPTARKPRHNFLHPLITGVFSWPATLPGPMPPVPTTHRVPASRGGRLRAVHFAQQTGQLLIAVVDLFADRFPTTQPLPQAKSCSFSVTTLTPQAFLHPGPFSFFGICTRTSSIRARRRLTFQIAPRP